MERTCRMNKEQPNQKRVNEGVDKMKSSPDFKLVIHGFDWGPGYSKMIIDIKKEILNLPDSFVQIEAKKQYTSFNMDKREIKSVDGESEVPILAHYLSDSIGNKVNSPSRYVTVELEVHPDNVFTNPFNYSFETGFNSYTEIDYTITQLNTVQTIDNKEISGFVLSSKELTEVFEPEAALFETGVHSYVDRWGKDLKLSYASYTPKEMESKRPLIIMLHGAGEGGTDPRIALYGNKSVSLVSNTVQDIFDGAHVLAPQSPTMWMDDGHGAYTKNGESKYTAALLDLIEDYIHNNHVDDERVYVGGGSNGGYMTVNLLLSKPELFAAAFPICQAYSSDWISDNQLMTIKEIPIWFVHCRNDQVVPYQSTTQELVERLTELGSSDVRSTIYDHVIDTSGNYTDDNGESYKYNDHWSWIYVYNNEIEDNGLSLFEWLASKKQTN